MHKIGQRSASDNVDWSPIAGPKPEEHSGDPADTSNRHANVYVLPHFLFVSSKLSIVRPARNEIPVLDSSSLTRQNQWRQIDNRPVHCCHCLDVPENARRSCEPKVMDLRDVGQSSHSSYKRSYINDCSFQVRSFDWIRKIVDVFGRIVTRLGTPSIAFCVFVVPEEEVLECHRGIRTSTVQVSM